MDENTINELVEGLDPYYGSFWESGGILIVVVIVFAVVVAISLAFTEREVGDEIAIINPQYDGRTHYNDRDITVAPSRQTDAPRIATEAPLPGPTGGGVDEQPHKTVPTLPSPAEHPYDTNYPQPFPPVHGQPSNAGTPVTNPPMSTGEPGTKPPYSATPQPPLTTSPGRDTQPPIIPNTLPATDANLVRLNRNSVTEMPLGCPVVPARGKLELAVKAWTNNMRHGVRYFGSGTVDMGVDGGWYDYDRKNCCDYYFRRVNGGNRGRAGSQWAAITPQAPHMQYTKLEPRGMKCDGFAGTPMMK